MEKVTISLSRKGNMRQYRIASPNRLDYRISDSDGWWLGSTKTDRINFALSEAKSNPTAIREAIGEVGLKLISSLAELVELPEDSRLFIVNAWTLIYVAQNAASDPNGKIVDTKIIAAIGKTLGREIEEIEPVQADDPVGSVFF